MFKRLRSAGWLFATLTAVLAGPVALFAWPLAAHAQSTPAIIEALEGG